MPADSSLRMSDTEQAEPGQLHDAKALTRTEVHVDVEAGPILVEGLGSVDVGDGKDDQLELEVHPGRQTVRPRNAAISSAGVHPAGAVWAAPNGA